MAGTTEASEKTFKFTVRSPRVEGSDDADFNLRMEVHSPDVTTQEFLDLCRTSRLRVGLKLYETHSQSPLHAEFRAAEVVGGGQENSVRARFEIPRRLFTDHQCRLVQIDLLYEGKFWFEQVLGAPPYLPIWIEKPAREVDVFDYYFRTYAPK